MINIKNKLTIFLCLLLLLFFNCCTYKKDNKTVDLKDNKSGNLLIGWASENITPDVPVIIHGQFHARISEGVMDPVTVTALAIESVKEQSFEKVIMISCDLVFITDDLRDAVRERVTKSLPEIKPEQIIINATHTHSGPQYSASREVVKENASQISVTSDIKNVYGIELDAMEFSDCLAFLVKRIAKAAEQAWNNRKPCGISYGLGHAVVGQNRLQAGFSGKSRMYGKTNREDFSHIEGYEDHSVNLLYTWDRQNNLTGVVINVACPSQVSEGEYLISADYWHDTRVELRERLGQDIFILPQCSSAGDQSPHLMVGMKAEERMQQLMFPDTEAGNAGKGRRKQIAKNIADAVTSVLPYMKDNIEWNPVFVHHMEVAELSRRFVGIEDVNHAIKEAEEWKKQYEQMLHEINEKPDIKQNPRWYTTITKTHRQMLRSYGIIERYKLEKLQPKLAIEVHGLRIGDIVIATNPFELYLDYGMRIKARSPAIQTFLVQLAGGGTYLPTTRSVAGGAYGAVPASTLVGPEGGQELVEKTLEIINNVMNR
jgi:hypothetical protein